MTAEQTAITVLFIYAITSSMMVIYVCRDARNKIKESHTNSQETQKIKEIAESEKEWFETTKEIREDGSVILYIHDKPRLKDSQKVWRMDKCGCAFSEDGGKMYRLSIPNVDCGDEHRVRAGSLRKEDLKWTGN